jgi:NitT/TauT family transport system substrate-binding protein
MSRPKRTVVLALIVITIVTVASVAFLYLNSMNNFFGKPQSITIGNLPLESSALLYVADKQGFFKQNGLEVTISDYETGLDSNIALINGKVDIAGGAELPLVRMAFQNQSVQAIAVINKSELEYVVARKDHGIENISDLEGKTVGLPKGTISEFYLNRFLSLNGVNPSNVTVVDMTLSQAQSALLNGDIDALVNWQPYTNTVEDGLGGNAVAWSVQGNQKTFGILTCRNDWIAANPELVNHFLSSLAQAEEFINTHPSDAKTIVKNQMNYTDAHMDIAWVQNQFSLSLGQPLVVALESEARWMISNKITNETSVPNFLNYIYLDGLMSVKPDSVNIIH